MGAMVSLTRPTPTRSSDPLTALCQRSQNAGALPLLTWYHGADRGELSARTLLTWVTKSVYLLDSEGVEPGGVSRLSVCGAHPGHWTSCVWLLASWWAGLRVDLTGQEEAALEVIGPDVSPDVLIQCSLAPLATACETLVSGAGADIPDKHREWLEIAQDYRLTALEGASDEQRMAHDLRLHQAIRRAMDVRAAAMRSGATVTEILLRNYGLGKNPFPDVVDPLQFDARRRASEVRDEMDRREALRKARAISEGLGVQARDDLAETGSYTDALAEAARKAGRAVGGVGGGLLSGTLGDDLAKAYADSRITRDVVAHTVGEFAHDTLVKNKATSGSDTSSFVWSTRFVITCQFDALTAASTKYNTTITDIGSE